MVFPQTEIGVDRGGIRAYAQAAYDLGYRHLVAYDHVVGADPLVHEGWSGPYDVSDSFHEPMVMFGYLAGICELELVTGILVAPQRQTALLAKQAAELDVVSNAKLRLGLGLGWNEVEYEALGQEFKTRGARLEEQIGLLRRYWTEESFTYDGRFDTARGVGISPLPLRRPIPIWIGAYADPALERVGRLADGWFPQAKPGGELARSLEIIDASARAAGRDPDCIGMEARVDLAGYSLDDVASHAESWRESGAAYLSVNTMRAGVKSADGHIEAIAKLADVLGVGRRESELTDSGEA